MKHTLIAQLSLAALILASFGGTLHPRMSESC
jgi:hypothetical protein